jgi:integrase/recombinase XerD
MLPPQNTLEEDYAALLRHKHYTDRTIEHKLICIRRFMVWLDKNSMTLSECGYSDVLSFLKRLKDDHFSLANQNTHITAIRQLYECQVRLEKLAHNPLVNLVVRGFIKRLPHDLLTPEQLSKIFDSYKPQGPYQQRNKVILGLYINQGLIRMEMSRLELQDVNLAKGTIRIRENVKLNERTLTLAAHQVLSMHEYISTVRPQLIRQSEEEKGNRLFFSYSSGQTTNEILKKLLSDVRRRNPEMTSFFQVRSSVISNWTREKPMREVQYMAGHNSLISTQRYQDVNLQDLQASLNEYHPLSGKQRAEQTKR